MISINQLFGNWLFTTLSKYKLYAYCAQYNQAICNHYAT